MTTLPNTPPHKDAIERAVRTFLWNLLITALTAVALAVATGLHNVRWTRDYWLAFLAKMGADVLAAVVSYVARYVVPPKP